MRRRLDFFQASLRLIYEWLFSVLVAYFIIVIFVGERPAGFIELCLLVIYLASYAIRRKAGYNIWIFAVHLLLFAGVWFLPFSNGSKWVLSGIVVYQMSEAFLYERRGNFGNFTDVPWPTFFASVIFYAYGYATKSSLLKTSAYIIPILLIIIYLLIIYIDGLKGYVEATKNVSGLPINKIASVNSSIVFLIVIMLLTGIMLGSLFGLDDALYKALRALLYVVSYVVFAIRLLLIILFRPLTKASDEQIEYEKSTFSGFASGHADDVAGILDIIYKVGAAILVIYILYKAASVIIRFFMKKRIVEGDRIEEAYVNKRIVSEKKNKKERKNVFSGEQKFRRLYRERILRHQYDIRLTSNKTCMDIRDELYDNELDDVSEITESYKAVRYGNKKATKEMFRLFDR